ncbi:unnamed protein product [Lupinus luteus]|uniref:Pentatricopeptide repeat-containing protein n=1 Tax=Lupinus luteus TaxID=3873 RepID=A0AAV1VZ09_LUPLU
MKHPLFSCFLRTFNSWTLALKYASSPRKSMHHFSKMHQKNVPFDSFCILFTLNSCTHFHNLPIIQHLHSHIIKLGFTSHVYISTSLLNAYVLMSFLDACILFDEMPHRNVVTWNTMIKGYLKSGNDIRRARQVFEQMPCRDMVSWSSMIAGYNNVGSYELSLGLFRQMMFHEGTKVDQVTVGSVLSACGKMGCVGLLAGKSVHGFMVKNGWELNVEIGDALVNMYAKCGNLRSGAQVFELMSERDVMTWTALICGASKHGFSEEALVVFDKMLVSGVTPNELTFTGVLSACAHGGLVEEGRRYFGMIEENGMEPRIQHYACLVYLVGKAGMLEEAYEIIRKMKLKPNIVVLASFLSACKEHRQFQMAESVIEQVLRMAKPEYDRGVYNLICDLYVMGKKIEEAERVRKLMLNDEHVDLVLNKWF